VKWANKVIRAAVIFILISKQFH